MEGEALVSLTPEQLAMRRTRITGTDATAIVGVNRYKTAHDVWLDKCGDASPQVENESMSLGHLLEAPILETAAKRRGVILVEASTVVDPVHSWFCATPDRLIVHPNPKMHTVGVAEAKLVGFRMAKDWGEEGDEVPDYVRIQVQCQMTVTRTKVALVAALIGSEVRIFDLEHEPDLEAVILEECERFHRVYVVPRIPPPPDATESSRRALEAAWPRSRGAMVPATSDMAQVARDYLDAIRLEKDAEQKKTLAGNLLRAYIADNDGVEGLGIRATWKASEGGGVDYAALAKALGATPEQIKQYQRPGTRRLLVKEVRT